MWDTGPCGKQKARPSLFLVINDVQWRLLCLFIHFVSFFSERKETGRERKRVLFQICPSKKKYSEFCEQLFIHNVIIKLCFLFVFIHNALFAFYYKTVDKQKLWMHSMQSRFFCKGRSHLNHCAISWSHLSM